MCVNQPQPLTKNRVGPPHCEPTPFIHPARKGANSALLIQSASAEQGFSLDTLQRLFTCALLVSAPIRNQIRVTITRIRFAPLRFINTYLHRHNEKTPVHVNDPSTYPFTYDPTPMNNQKNQRKRVLTACMACRAKRTKVGQVP